jgi:secreted trypsin-like serine protease
MVLTAAHCLGGTLWADMVIHFTTDQNRSHQTAKVIDRRAALDRIPIDHQEFDWGDVAVVKFEGTAPAPYQPIKLETVSLVKTNDTVVLAGYGRTTAAEPSNGRDGVGVLRSVDQTLLQVPYGQTEILINIKDKGPCSGDSGGPAFIEQNGELIQVGIASRLTNHDITPGTKDTYTCSVDLVYSHVSVYVPWIQSAIQSMK